MPSSAETRTLVAMQRSEVTAAIVYKKMAKLQKYRRNAEILEQISEEESRHADELSRLSGFPAEPNAVHVAAYTFLTRAFGLSFGLKLMEKGERAAARSYHRLGETIPQLNDIAIEEEEHETALLSILDDPILRNIGAIVLGLSDAIVDLTGALAGFTLALGRPRLIAITGLITGVSGALGMTASGFLSAREEASPDKPPVKFASYTGLAYIAVLATLIMPFFLCSSAGVAFVITLLLATTVIAMFSFYIHIARDERFMPRFLRMAILSGVVSLTSYCIGALLNRFVQI